MLNRLRSLLHVPAPALITPGSAALDDAGTADALVVDLTGDGWDRAASGARVREATAGARARLPVLVRVSGVASPRLAEDLAMVLPARPSGVVLSGVAGPADVEELGARLRVSEAELGRADGETRIVPVIGTPAGVLALAGQSFASASFASTSWAGLGRIAAFAWEPPHPPACDDPLTDVARLARAFAVLAAGRAGVVALDPLPRTDAAGDAFRRACLAALREGIGGAAVRSVEQAGIANAVFPGGPAPAA